MKQHKGFTLIELIVTVGIIMMLLSGVVVNFSRFNDDQRLEQVGLTLQEDLRLAQGKALSGQKPSSGDCTALYGYRVTFTESSYTIVPECSEGSDYSDESVSVTLPQNVTFAEPLCPSFIFRPLSQGTDLAASTDVILSSGTSTYTITIYRSGVVNEKGSA